MKKRFFAWAATALALWTLPAKAEWLTQSITLQAGWNAVFLHVDATHATIDQLVGAGSPALTPIQQIWRWNPNPATGQFITSPQQPINNGSQWTSWKRPENATSSLQRLTANSAYLVYSTSSYTWDLKGRPVLPHYEWTTSGLNFFGFPTVPANPPNFDPFLSPVPDLLSGEVFRYPGGELGAGNPVQVFGLRTTAVRRGEAYWLRAGEFFNSYYGPFEVTAAGAGQYEFGDSQSSTSFRLRNLTASPLTVTLRQVNSESPPSGQAAVAGALPLLLRGNLNPTNLTYPVNSLTVGQSSSWTLAPKGQEGSETEVVLGVERSALTGIPGTRFAGVLQLTDSLGQTRLDMAVSAVVGSKAGLWVGSASISHVSQYLQSYLRGNNNQLVVQTNGAYQVTDVKTNLTPVPTSYPLRLIVHNPSTGPATLLQQVFFGFNAATNPIVSISEAALLAPHRAQSRRITASHLPWTEENNGWAFSGALSQGSVIRVSVTNRFDDQSSNPFLHTYHPDHDNLDATFRKEVPQGSESYTIVRDISLNPQSPATDFNSRISTGQTIEGEYLETIRVLGLARPGNTFDTRRFDVRGRFKLNRINDVPAITRAP